jgi:hypothetical protein
MRVNPAEFIDKSHLVQERFTLLSKHHASVRLHETSLILSASKIPYGEK